MSLAERVGGKVHCIGCGRLYQHSDLQFVGVGEEELDLYINCHACSLYVRLTVPKNEVTPTMIAVGLPSAVNPVEREEALATPVTVEDVSAMREFLSTFDGDVAHLLGCDRSGEGR